MIMANNTDVSKTDSTWLPFVVPNSIGVKMPRNGFMARSRFRYAHSTKPDDGLAPNSNKKKPIAKMTSTNKM